MKLIASILHRPVTNCQVIVKLMSYFMYNLSYLGQDRLGFFCCNLSVLCPNDISGLSIRCLRVLCYRFYGHYVILALAVYILLYGACVLIL